MDPRRQILSPINCQPSMLPHERQGCPRWTYLQLKYDDNKRLCHQLLARHTRQQGDQHTLRQHHTQEALMEQALVRYQDPSRPRSGSPVNTTVLEWRGRLKAERTDTDTTSIAGPTSSGISSTHNDMYCLYAMDLQRYRSQQLSACITSDPVPYCPHCKSTLHLSSGKAWEVRKDDDGDERCFQISNRFVVKCHRGGADGQYACVLCSRHADVDSVCGDVKALIKHIWEEHSIAELKHEEDITEVVELTTDRRRDSGLGYSTSRSSRRSASLGPSSRRR
jgi:hypothetical protein